MFDDFYGLTEKPFQLTPDPAFYFRSTTHRKALSYLGYGLAQGEGFIVVTGEIGAGKSTLVAHLMATIDRARLNAISLVSTQVEGDDMLRLAAQGLGIATRGEDEHARDVEQSAETAQDVRPGLYVRDVVPGIDHQIRLQPGQSRHPALPGRGLGRHVQVRDVQYSDGARPGRQHRHVEPAQPKRVHLISDPVCQRSDPPGRALVASKRRPGRSTPSWWARSRLLMGW